MPLIQRGNSFYAIGDTEAVTLAFRACTFFDTLSSGIFCPVRLAIDRCTAYFENFHLKKGVKK
jgi:hypothetical protein